MKRSRSILLLFLLLLLVAVPAQGSTDQTASLLYDEARTVYLGNLQRRANGVPPLRWNRQLTNAARWFSWDSTENRPTGFCGHQDTNGGWPSDRAVIFGYPGFAGAENAFCGYVTPEYAIQGWMNSSGHRDNLLDPNSREIGLGYYRRTSDGRGYVTQDFGVDAVYAPVIIENEALNTTSQQVGLYIYDRQSGGGFSELGHATEMLIGKDRCFTGASWQAYQTEKNWTLDPGTGWRPVYVKTRDTLGRTLTVSDTIYLGSTLPLSELGYAQMSTTSDRVTLYDLDGQGLSKMQFSLDWRVDNTHSSFQLWWGNGQLINDAAAWGSSAFRMYDGNGESMSWVYTSEFIRDTPLVAYVRLKVSSNLSTSEIARVAVGDENTTQYEITLKGTDFKQANQYQEFALPFTFASGQQFLIFNFWRSGTPDVVFDALTIFTAPVTIASPYTWVVPGGHYRGQGVWVRYTDGANQFSEIVEADTSPVGLGFSGAPVFLVQQGGALPPAQVIKVLQLGCQVLAWQVSDDRAWITTQVQGDQVLVSANPTGLAVGTYSGTVTITPTGGQGGTPLQIPVRLVVAQNIYKLYQGAVYK